MLLQKDFLQMLMKQSSFQKLPGLLNLCFDCLAPDECTEKFAEANY